MLPLHATRLVVWGNAFLLGWASLDEAAERAAGAADRPRVDGLPIGDGVSLAVALGYLSRSGCTGLRLALPVPGDASSLPGPSSFNAVAMDAGAAVLCEGTSWGLVPAPAPVRWLVLETSARTPVVPGLSDADRLLRAAVRTATEKLTLLDVAGAGHTAEEGLARVRDTRTAWTDLPPTYPARAHELLTRAVRIMAVVEVAVGEDGAARSATAMTARRASLDVLATVARQAAIAACNAPLDAAVADRPRTPG